MLPRCTTYSCGRSEARTWTSAHEGMGTCRARACSTRPLYSGLSVGLGYTTRTEYPKWCRWRAATSPSPPLLPGPAITSTRLSRVGKQGGVSGVGWSVWVVATSPWVHALADVGCLAAGAATGVVVCKAALRGLAPTTPHMPACLALALHLKRSAGYSAARAEATLRPASSMSCSTLKPSWGPISSSSTAMASAWDLAVRSGECVCT